MRGEPFDELRPPVSLGARGRIGTRSLGGRQSQWESRAERVGRNSWTCEKTVGGECLENYNQISRREGANGISGAQ